MRKNKISRRQFLSSAAALAAGLALSHPDLAAAGPLLQQGEQWQCPCGQVFESVEALEAHIAAAHPRKMPVVKKVDKPTYERFLVGPVGRFDQKNIIFSRTVWDEEYKRRLASARPRPLGNEWQEFEGQALVSGSGFVVSEDKTGASGHLRGVPGLYAWDGRVNEKKMPVDDLCQMTDRVKQVAKFLGADLVGICKVDPRWVYSNYFDRETGASGPLEIPHKYAIMMAIEMSWKWIDQSPGYGGGAASFLGYSRMAELAGSMAQYVRSLGYAAIPSGNDTTQNIPMAIDAGLGELGRLGLLVTPEFGPRVRLCKVLTDLPLAPDLPVDFGMQRWCPICGLCARRCPAGAIRAEERTAEPACASNRTGILRWPVQVEKCHIFWQENRTPCAVCLAACPWGWNVRRWL